MIGKERFGPAKSPEGSDFRCLAFNLAIFGRVEGLVSRRRPLGGTLGQLRSIHRDVAHAARGIPSSSAVTRVLAIERLVAYIASRGGVGADIARPNRER